MIDLVAYPLHGAAMRLLSNPFRGRGLQTRELDDVPLPSVAGNRPVGLLKRCPRAAETPLTSAQEIALACGVGSVHIKDERDRMGLGSFKALGAAYVIARDAEAGQLYHFVGGEGEDLEIAKGFLNATGRGHAHLGDIGAGAAAKVAP